MLFHTCVYTTVTNNQQRGFYPSTTRFLSHGLVAYSEITFASFVYQTLAYDVKEAKDRISLVDISSILVKRVGVLVCLTIESPVAGFQLFSLCLNAVVL